MPRLVPGPPARRERRRQRPHQSARFHLDADGQLYLALAGTGGPNQVITPDGTPFPFFGGLTSSTVRVEGGCTVPVAENIASFFWSDPGWIWG